MNETINYFNYFTEIEEHFQRARGTSLFLLSPLDWALIEGWKSSGVPLEAVLRGIDVAFEKWRARRSRTQNVNSLAFCAQAVMTEAQRAPISDSQPHSLPRPDPFSREEILEFLDRNIITLQAKKDYNEIARMLQSIRDTYDGRVEDLERRLTVLEQKMISLARAAESEENALSARRQLESQLAPYRGKMNTEQLAMLERQFLERKLLEREQLPRLSLFYLR